MKLEQGVPKRRHVKFRRRVITQKKAYNNYLSATQSVSAAAIIMVTAAETLWVR
jgi:hypothetical protein